MLSLPSWERGLKCEVTFDDVKLAAVAPFVGAWIEIRPDEGPLRDYETSLPSWERGLKLLPQLTSCSQLLSLPSWERGLKSVFVTCACVPGSRRSLRGSVD